MSGSRAAARGDAAMTATAEATAGQELTATLRRYFKVWPRTRRYRPRGDYRQDLHHSMTEAIALAATHPGYFGEEMTAALRPGWGTFLAYDKHVSGYRIDGTLRQHITSMSPWEFAGLLGAMVDAGVTCTGEGEQFFAQMAREQRAAS